MQTNTHTLYTYNIRQIVGRYGVLGWDSLCLGGLSYAKEKNLITSKLIFLLTNLVSKCPKLLLKCIKILGFRAAAPDPAEEASAHPRPPSLSPRAFGAQHITPLFCQEKLPPKSPSKTMDTLEVSACS